MTEQTKLILALMQIDNLTNLVKDNEYERFINGHLMSVKIEIERQLSHYGKTKKLLLKNKRNK